MADVFISYARDDRGTAQEVARLIESQGFSVWWDRDLTPGNEFSEVIEQTLDNAKAVIVLWSETSRKSHWVRDEAAVGRDRNRLVPIALDATPPPLGFRQIHTITLADLKNTRIRAALTGSLGALCGRAAPTPSAPAQPTPKAAPVDKPIAQILQEEKNQRSFVGTFWLMGLPLALLIGVVVAVLGQMAETYPIRSLPGNFALGFILGSISLGLGRLLIVAGRRLSRRKSVRYFDGPTKICLGLSLLIATTLALVAKARSGIGDSTLVGVFLATFTFPVFALISVGVGFSKGLERTTFENGR